MIKIKKYQFLIILFITLFPAFVIANEMVYHGPSCLGEFCFNVDSWGEYPKRNNLERKHGSGFVKKGKFPFHCYVLRDGNYVEFRVYHGEERNTIVEISINNKPICEKHAKPKIPFQSITTPEGLKIGDSFKKVISIYGLPDYIAPSEKINTTFNHNEENKFKYANSVFKYLQPKNSGVSLNSFVYIEKDKVSSIIISAY